MLYIRNPSVGYVQVQPSNKGSMATGLNDECVPDPGGAFEPVVRVTADEDVDALNGGREFDILRKTQMRQYDNQVDSLGAL
ncbi:hypothetical protein [Bradyrhizobium betae]|uniref:hypothetical protein n=1 Tax=Bradyrhizobium betae TaxID=244734 RepID=UPI0030842123